MPRLSWRGLGAIMALSWPKTTQRAPKTISLDPLGRRCWKPKLNKNRSGSDPKCEFFHHLFNRFLKRFGANLDPTWFPKLSQNEAKLASRSHPRGNQQKSQKHKKHVVFQGFWRVRGSQVGGKIDQTSIQKVSKTRCDFECILDGSWIDFWSILGPSWTPSWAKLAPKSEERAYQDDVKKSLKIWVRSGTQGYARSRGEIWSWPLRIPLGSLILESKSTRGKAIGPRNTPIGHEARGRI